MTKIDWTPTNILGLARISIYGALLFTYLVLFENDLPGWINEVPPQAWRPAGIVALIPDVHEILRIEGIAALVELIFLGSTILCCCGLYWKYSRWLTWTTSLLIFGLLNSFGHSFRSESPLILAQFPLLFAPGVLGLSLDSRTRGLKHEDAGQSETIWGLRLLWVSIFFFAGLTKVRETGFTWVSENFLSDYMMANQITRSGILNELWFAEWTSYLLPYQRLIWLAGLSVFAFELLYPLVVFVKFRPYFLILTFVFQTAVFVFMGVNFFFYFALLPIWIHHPAIELNFGRFKYFQRLRQFKTQ